MHFWKKGNPSFRAGSSQKRGMLTLKKASNRLLIEMEYRLRRPYARGHPYIIFVDTINSCNLHCPLCPNWLPEDNHFSRYYPVSFKDKYFSARRVCPWLWRSAVINWDGTVSPCCVYEGPKSDLGLDVFQVGFDAIRNNVAYRVARSAFCINKKGTIPYEGFNICQHCRAMPRALDPKQHGMY